jgi:hypothetical protein
MMESPRFHQSIVSGNVSLVGDVGNRDASAIAEQRPGINQRG